MRAEILSAIETENDIGQRILTVAGGKGWPGKPIVLLGAGSASQAARQVLRKRGVVPSDTSMQEAATEAATACWIWWSRYERRVLRWSVCRDVVTLWPRVRRAIGLVGWRAAYRSLTADRRAVTGRHAEAVCTVPLDEAAHAVELQSFTAWSHGHGDAPRANGS